MSEKKEESLLQATNVVKLGVGIQLYSPLSRKGHGPPLIIVVPEASAGVRGQTPTQTKPTLSSQQKWAEEGFTVVQIQPSSFDEGGADAALKNAFKGLDECTSCDGGNAGLIVYTSEYWNLIEPALASNPRIVAAVGYGAFGNETSDGMLNYSIPHIYHFASKAKAAGERKYEYTEDRILHEYPQAVHESFADPFSSDFKPSSEALSHTKNLEFLKKRIGGPYFDLEAIWDEHTKFEFGERSVEKTMATMVQEPYVNHIPTMTGGIGRERLTDFYRCHFIFSNPEDTELELVSRTVGIDRVVDEFVFSFTHTKQIDWILPGIPPTGKEVQIPFTSVVNFRGDRLYHEHIAWDQASVLVQLELMPEYLDFPYDLPDGSKPAPKKKFQYKVPAAGADTARKILDKDSVPSNKMFEYKAQGCVPSNGVSKYNIREVDI